MVYQVLRTSRGVFDRGRGNINSHVVVERGKDLLHVNRAVLGLLGILSRAANDLACLHATTGQDTHRDSVPVVTATLVVVDSGCPAKFTPHDD